MADELGEVAAAVKKGANMAAGLFKKPVKFARRNSPIPPVTRSGRKAKRDAKADVKKNRYR